MTETLRDYLTEKRQYHVNIPFLSNTTKVIFALNDYTVSNFQMNLIRALLPLYNVIFLRNTSV